MKTLNKIIIISLIASPLIALAQPQTAPVIAEDPEALLNLIDRATNWFFSIILVLAVIFILVSAFEYLTAWGNEERLKAAKNTLVYALVAIVLAVLARGIVSIVVNVLVR